MDLERLGVDLERLEIDLERLEVDLESWTWIESRGVDLES